jgi:uncharacterized protein
MNAFIIDAFEFCRLKERREGRIAVAKLVRLSEDTADTFGDIDWALQGGSNHLGYPQLSLSVSGEVKLMCQRCLLPFAFEIQSESTLVLVENEADVDGVDAQLDDDAVDVIAGSRSMNILELVEDEALLSLPLSPRHERCPDKAVSDAASIKEDASPFAVLKNIKQ